MPRRLVVIGGDASGMSAASRAKRRAGDDIEVIAVERGLWTSYSQCGIPYWIAGEIGTEDDLVARTPDEHRANGIDVRVGTEAIELQLDRGRIVVRDVASGDESHIGYDDLVLATGARPVRPSLPGLDAHGVFGIQTIDHGRRVLAALATRRPMQRAVIVGGGFIGVEMAETMLARGLHVTLVSRTAQPMNTLDADVGALITESMERHGMDVRNATAAAGFEVDEAGWVSGVRIGEELVECDVVALGIGVEPDTSLAVEAGIEVGENGGIRPDDSMRVADGLWAAGDCVEVRDRVLDRWKYTPLGTHANKQGVVIGDNVTGGSATFPGVVRTAITRFVDLEIARTGALEHECGDLDVASVTIEATTHAGYLPDADPMTIKLTFDKPSGRVLGAQIVGGRGAGMRINVVAMALWSRLTVEELMMTDLAYAPPFSSVWDPVQVAARAAIAARR